VIVSSFVASGKVDDSCLLLHHKSMTPKELKTLASYMEVLKVRDSLHLTDRQRAIFNLIYLHGYSLAQVYDSLQTDKDLKQYACSESTIAHESSTIRRMLKWFDASIASLQ